jgi:hypothetical protein
MVQQAQLEVGEGEATYELAMQSEAWTMTIWLLRTLLLRRPDIHLITSQAKPIRLTTYSFANPLRAWQEQSAIQCKSLSKLDLIRQGKHDSTHRKQRA